MPSISAISSLGLIIPTHFRAAATRPFHLALNYRISADYGTVAIAKSLTPTSEDLFGPTVNICSKINSMASPNSMVLGGDLYKIVKRILDKDYYFNKVGEYPLGDLEIQYPVYCISSKSKTSNAQTLSLYKIIFEPYSETI